MGKKSPPQKIKKQKYNLCFFRNGANWTMLFMKTKSDLQNCQTNKMKWFLNMFFLEWKFDYFDHVRTFWVAFITLQLRSEQFGLLVSWEIIIHNIFELKKKHCNWETRFVLPTWFFFLAHFQIKVRIVLIWLDGTANRNEGNFQILPLLPCNMLTNHCYKITQYIVTHK